MSEADIGGRTPQAAAIVAATIIRHRAATADIRRFRRAGIKLEDNGRQSAKSLLPLNVTGDDLARAGKPTDISGDTTMNINAKSILGAAGLLFTLSTTANAEDYVFTAPPRDVGGGNESAVYGPIAAYLSAATGKKIVYEHSDNWLSYQDNMRKGKFDLVFDGPHFLSWRVAKLQHEPLAKLPGKLAFVVVAKKDNDKISSVKDLSGRTVCGLAPPNLATLTLYSQFDNAARQPLVLAARSFKEAFEMMNSGKCTAAAMGKGFFKNLDKGESKVVWESPGVPNQAFSAGPRFTEQDRSKMIAALTAPEAAAKMEKFFSIFSKDKALVAAKRDEFDGIANLLKDAYGFELAAAPATAK